jgi:putative ABC transport system permease protein
LFSLILCGLGPIGVVSTGMLAQVHVAQMQESLRKFGGRLVVVSPNKTPPFPGRPRQLAHFISLVPEDVNRLASSIQGADAIVPVAARDTTIRFGSRAARVRLIGTTEDYVKVRGFGLAEGRFLSAADGRERVIVIGHAITTELASQSIHLGDSVYLGLSAYRVVGILEPQGVNFAGEDEDRQVFVPLNAYQLLIANRPWLSHIYLQLSPDSDAPTTLIQIQDVLRNVHGRWRDQVDDVIVRDFADLAARQTTLLTTATWVVSVTTALILILGVAGIAALMLAMVRERRTEIGLRRALGASRVDAGLQFFVEGIALASIGVISGLALSLLGASAAVHLMHLPVQTDFRLFLWSAALSVATTSVSCAFPAVVASRVEPGVILRT